MIPLKQFIPQEICLGCDICCRFTSCDTIWAPIFTEEEIKLLVDSNTLPPLLFTETKSKHTHRINLKPYKDYFICPCFNPQDNKCKIYHDRPFECRLYPFLLVKEKDKFCLAYDKKCAYMKDDTNKDREGYVECLRSEFKKKENQAFLRQHQELFFEYPLDDIVIVSDLNT